MTGLDVTNLRKTFADRGGIPGSRQRTVAVDDVSFTVGPGESLGLVGESGSGKTTVARILVGLELQDSGTISVGGQELAPSRSSRARLRRARQVQLVFQDPYSTLDPRLTPLECLDAALKLVCGGDRRARRARARELLDQVGLGSRESTVRPRQLSGGQRQRVAIARALAADPSVLVLDEPVAALDVSIQAQVLELLADIRAESGMSVVFISHDLAVIRQVTDRTMVMHRGSLVESGQTDRMLAAPQHPYTKLLLASVPGPGWDPAEVSRLRKAVVADASPTS